MSNVYAAAIVFRSDAGDENDVTEELIDALTTSRLPIDIRFIGGAAQIPDLDDEYASEIVAPYIAGDVKLDEGEQVADELRHRSRVEADEATRYCPDCGSEEVARSDEGRAFRCGNCGARFDTPRVNEDKAIEAGEMSTSDGLGADDPLSRFSITCRPAEGWTITFDALPYQPFKAPLSMSETEAIAAATTKARAFV